MNGDSLFLKNPELAAAVAEHLYDSIVVYEVKSNNITAVFVNSSFCRLTGYADQELLGNAPLFSSNKGSGSKLYQEVVDSIQLESDYDKEIFCLNKNGIPFWAYLRSVPFKTARNHFHILILRDTTRMKQKESELKNALKDVEDSKKMKDRFLANMSHEMRTPINGIMGMAQLLEDTNLTKQQQDYLEELKLSSETLLAIVNDILEFNFIESGALKLQSRKFNIRKHLDQIFKTLNERADKKGLKLEMAVSDKVPEVLIGDVVRFSQVLMHIIGNSIKFTKDGKVHVFVRKIEMETKRVPIEIKVQDTGIGIPRDLLQGVFDSFNKASRYSTQKYGGTGLGLSIVDQLVKRMDGRIDIKSSEGQGTTFILTLPFEIYETDKKKQTDELPGEDKTSVSGATVLVVDDYLVNRRIVKGMLEKLGNEVHEAEDGESALELIKKNNYSIVLMDVHMPGMGGLETTKRIRQFEKPAKRNVPVVAITASVLERDIEECKEAGMDDFIAKPFTKAELVGTVKAHVEADETEKGNYQSIFDSVDETALQAEINLEPLLEMTDGDRQMAREMAELYLLQTPEMISRIKDLFESRDFVGMSTTAHTIKPTFNYIGLENGYKLALQLEEAGKTNDPDEDKISMLINRLEKLCESSVEQLKEKIDVLL